MYARAHLDPKVYNPHPHTECKGALVGLPKGSGVPVGDALSAGSAVINVGIATSIADLMG